MREWLRKDEEGQGLVEYALILVLVAAVVIVILALLGPQISQIFSCVRSGLDGHSWCSTPTPTVG